VRVGLSRWLGGLHERSRNWGKWRLLYVILLPWLALAAWGATFRRGRSVAYVASAVVAILWLSVVAGAVSGPPPEQGPVEAAATRTTLATPTIPFATTTTTAPTTTTTSATTTTTITLPTTTTLAIVLPEGDNTVVERITDGDTIVVTGAERVRLIGIDTPEVNQDACYAAEATGFISSLIPPGMPVRLVYDVELYDRFDRTLAYVYRLDDGLFVNAEMMSQGYAVILTIPPNVAHAEEFLALQQEAREAGRGLWSACQLTTTTTQAPPATQEGETCDPSYPDVCIPPPPPDLDCGEIPHRRFSVVGSDPHGFDGDSDGIGCES
jgi:micrococcal nuclease